MGIARAGGGGNVTLPHKGDAAGLLDRPSEAVRRTGACNTFWLEDDEIHGDNTDVEGFRRALESALPGPHVDATSKEGARRHHDGLRPDPMTTPGHHATHSVQGPTRPGDEAHDPVLEEIEPFELFEAAANRPGIEPAIALGAGAPHRRTPASVQHPVVDPRRIGGPAHDAAQGIHFPSHDSLRDSPDGRVAAHLSEPRQVGGHQEGPNTEARRRARRLGTGGASPDHHDDVRPLQAAPRS